MIPAGYAEFCEGAGLNPYHPEGWTAAEQATFRAWRLEAFRAKWRFLRERGDVAHRVAMGQRARLLADVRQDLDRALGPAPCRSPWRTCPCHRQRFVSPDITPDVWEAVDDEDVAAWRAGDRAARQDLPRRTAVALTYLDTFFKPKPKEPDHHGHRRTAFVRHTGPPPGALRSFWPDQDRS